MCDQKLGDRDRAKQWYDRTTHWLAKVERSPTVSGTDSALQDSDQRLELKLLRQEAGDLLAGPPAKNNP
jgi:hypothetical protein